MILPTVHKREADISEETDCSSWLKESGPDTYVFGSRVRTILRRSALGQAATGQPGDSTFGDAYLSAYRRRHTNLLTSLTNPRDDRFVYDLRLVARPNPEVYTKGRVELALLCKARGVEEQQAERYARHLHSLLDANFPEYTFERLAPSEVDHLRRPFSIGHLVSLTRRAGWERFDTLRHTGPSQRRIGFEARIAASAADGGEEARSAFHIFPFHPTWDSFAPLFRLMLRARAPVAVSCRLRPTALTEDEESFLERQIARCERAAQTRIEPSSNDGKELYPTLRKQARAYQEYQARLLYGLSDNAAVMTLEVASEQEIPVPLLDCLGNLVTNPAGVSGNVSLGADTPRPYLAGGYEFLDHSDDEAATSAFVELDLHPSDHPSAPEEGKRLVHLFDSVEGFALFRLPPSPTEELPGVPVQSWRMRPPPPELPEEGTKLGVSWYRGLERPVRVSAEDRKRHQYVVGQTGTGKTTLLKTMVLDDMRKGRGLCLVDPHGDLFSDLLGKIPESRMDDVVVIDPTDSDYPVGLNVLEHQTEKQRHFLVQEIVGMIRRLLQDEYGAKASEFAGPIFWQHMRRNLLLAMSDPEDPGTLVEFYSLFQKPDYWKRWVPLQISDPLLEHWVEEVLPETDYLRQDSEGLSLGGYVGSKFEGFVFDPLLRNIFCQPESTVDLGAAMDEGRIVLVNLAKGELTEANARFFGMVLMAKIMTVAMERVHRPTEERKEFHLYVDEFQSLATQSFVTLLSEARKFGLSLTLANQFVGQIQEERIVDAIFGNVGTIVCFRVGEEDAEILEQAYAPTFSRFDLVNLPNWRACVSTLVEGQTVPPFTLSTVLDERSSREATAEKVRKASREKYARRREAVENEYRERLTVI